MFEKLKQATHEIAKQRKDFIEKLAQFAETDLLLFWGRNKELAERQEKVWGPILAWAKEALDTKFVVTDQLEVPEENKHSLGRFKLFLNGLSDKELAAFYLAALNMRSVLLAAALVKGRLNARQAFETSCLEELWQAEKWGVEEEAEKRRQSLKQELVEIEDFLKHD